MEEGGVSWVIDEVTPNQRKGYARDDDRVVELETPSGETGDALTEVLRKGAKRMLDDAVEAEVETFLAVHGAMKDGSGRRQVVRNGYLPEREIRNEGRNNLCKIQKF